MPDKGILAWALKENRIIVTTDKDFDEMIWQPGQNHCGVLRIENLPRLERMALVKDVVRQHAEDPASSIEHPRCAESPLLSGAASPTCQKPK
jgi:predicted nuclease of predicted toxin-antitoxin system